MKQGLGWKTDGLWTREAKLAHHQLAYLVSFLSFITIAAAALKTRLQKHIWQNKNLSLGKLKLWGNLKKKKSQLLHYKPFLQGNQEGQVHPKDGRNGLKSD